MKLPNPTNSTNKTTNRSNHLLRTTLVSSFLTLMACTMLTPKTQNHAANYVDPRPHSTDQTVPNPDPGYKWFY